MGEHGVSGGCWGGGLGTAGFRKAGEGNSGGPLLDQSGHVVGVVSSKLDALRVAKVYGDLPQNVNFAIKASLAQAFLQRQGIAYQSAASVWEHKSADIGAQARAFTLVVECWK